jgi:methyl-accepting chemotaxis protein
MKLSFLLLASFGLVILPFAVVGFIGVLYVSQVSGSLGISNSIPKLLVIFESIILVLGLFVGYSASRLISKPLAKFSETVGEISKGNFNVEIKPEEAGKIDEIRTLADSLSRIMTTMKFAVKEAKGKGKGK